MNDINKIIDTFREIVPDAEYRYTNGGCFQFYRLLHSIDDSAEPYYDGDHVITRIDDKFYDVTGEVECGRHLPMMDEPNTYWDAFTWEPEEPPQNTLD